MRVYHYFAYITFMLVSSSATLEKALSLKCRNGVESKTTCTENLRCQEIGANFFCDLLVNRSHGLLKPDEGLCCEVNECSGNAILDEDNSTGLLLCKSAADCVAYTESEDSICIDSKYLGKHCCYSSFCPDLFSKRVNEQKCTDVVNCSWGEQGAICENGFCCPKVNNRRQAEYPYITSVPCKTSIECGGNMKFCNSTINKCQHIGASQSLHERVNDTTCSSNDECKRRSDVCVFEDTVPRKGAGVCYRKGGNDQNLYLGMHVDESKTVVYAVLLGYNGFSFIMICILTVIRFCLKKDEPTDIKPKIPRSNVKHQDQ